MRVAAALSCLLLTQALQVPAVISSRQPLVQERRLAAQCSSVQLTFAATEKPFTSLSGVYVEDTVAEYDAAMPDEFSQVWSYSTDTTGNSKLLLVVQPINADNFLVIRAVKRSSATAAWQLLPSCAVYSSPAALIDLNDITQYSSLYSWLYANDCAGATIDYTSSVKMVSKCTLEAADAPPGGTIGTSPAVPGPAPFTPSQPVLNVVLVFNGQIIDICKKSDYLALVLSALVSACPGTAQTAKYLESGMVPVNGRRALAASTVSVGPQGAIASASLEAAHAEPNLRQLGATVYAAAFAIENLTDEEVASIKASAKAPVNNFALKFMASMRLDVWTTSDNAASWTTTSVGHTVIDGSPPSPGPGPGPGPGPTKKKGGSNAGAIAGAVCGVFLSFSAAGAFLLHRKRHMKTVTAATAPVAASAASAPAKPVLVEVASGTSSANKSAVIS